MKYLCFTLLMWLFIWPHTLWAGKCRYDTLTPARGLVSSYMAGQVRQKVLDVEQQMQARGEDVHVVLLARSSTIVNGFHLLRDQPEVPWFDYLYQVADHIMGRRTEFLWRQAKGENKEALAHLLRLDPSYQHPQPLVYSHLGFLLKTNPRVSGDLDIPDWSYVVHLEPECIGNTKRYGESEIFYDLLDQFYWDSAVLKAVSKSKHATALHTKVIVPAPRIQQQLWQLTQKAEYSKHELHQPRYNAGSVPFVSLNYKKTRQNLKAQRKGRAIKHKVPEPYQLLDQNSNQWVLELLAAAQHKYGQVKTRRQAQQILLNTNYRPSLMWPYTFLTLHLCHLIKGPFGLWDWSNLYNCRPQVWRSQNLVQGITVRSVEDYLVRNNLVARDVGVNPRWGRERSTAVQHDRPPYSVYSVHVDEKKVEQLIDVAKRFEAEPCPAEFQGYWCDLRSGVPVAKNSLMKQCASDSGISIELMEKELVQIEVRHRQRLHDGHMRASLCGLDAGLFNVYWVPEEQVDQATELGFLLWSELLQTGTPLDRATH